MKKALNAIILLLGILVFLFAGAFVFLSGSGVEFTRNTFGDDEPSLNVIREYLAANRAPKEKPVVKKEEPKVVAGTGENVVLWISLAGFRQDYQQRADTPFLDSLAESGASTNKFRPTFPPTTFASHTSLATGTPVSGHGVFADQLRDSEGVITENPDSSEWILTEPIWETATRQGRPTMVHDWPLSQKPKDENKPAVFKDSYNPLADDASRLDEAFEAWTAASSGDEKLRLVMLRLDDIYWAGLKNGPRSDDTYAVIKQTDATLKSFIDKVQENWSSLAPPGANLVILISTDHGMAERTKNVNLPDLIGPEMADKLDIIAHDGVANLFFKNLPESEGERDLLVSRFDGEMSKKIYFRYMAPDKLSKDWSYASDGRTGDRVLALKGGYAFVSESSDEPVFDAADGPGFFGGYGYPVDESIRMSGVVILSGIPKAPKTGSLGEIDSLPFHKAVCELLKIEPSPDASPTSLLDAK